MQKCKYFIFTEETLSTFTGTDINIAFNSVRKELPLPNIRALYDELNATWYVAVSKHSHVPLKYVETEKIPAILKAYLLLNPV